MDELNEEKNKHYIGDKITLKVYRDGKTQDIQLTLGESNQSFGPFGSFGDGVF